MKGATVRVLLILSATFLPGAALAQWQTSFVANPSVEEDANRDGSPDGWHGDAFNSPARLLWDATVAHSGGHSLRIGDSLNPAGREWNETTGRWILAARKPVTAGETYTLESWIKTDAVTGQADARIAWFSDKNWLAENVTPRVKGSHDWRRVTVTAQAPAGAVSAMVYLGLTQSKGTAWFDDVVMVAGRRLPGNYRTVDLSGDAKGELTAPQGPAAEPTLRGVPFHLLRQQPGAANVRAIVVSGQQPGTPKEATIPVGRKCETLYFLHVCRDVRNGSQVGQYELWYQDGKVVSVPMRVGREIGDLNRPTESKQSAVGWEWDQGDGRRALGLLPIENPRPDKPLREIRISTPGGQGSLSLLALTTADGPAVLTERPIRYEFNDTAGWYPFTFPLNDTNLDSIDLTGLLDGPAGKHGFLAVRPDGHFYFADGTRARFFGTNICGRGAAPEKDAAPVIAARLAKYGVNLLRIHAIDGRWGPLVDQSQPDSRHFDAGGLDRLDHFFAELKKRGIYVYFDCLDYRYFKEGDGVKDASQFEHGWRHSIKGASCFNERMIELEKEFATQFYTHVNPYTKLRYADDPAVAVVEITNENSVFYFQNTELTLPCYREELEKRWNAWLRQQYTNRAALAEAWTDARGQCALLPEEDPARDSVVLPLKHLYQNPAKAAFVGPASPPRVNAMVRFLFEIERSYYRQMHDHLRQIGVRVPITGTNQTFCPASNAADSVNDFMSRNNYWQHPNVNAKPHFTFRNLAVVKSDLSRVDNPITEVASSSVAGKPMIVPEFNFPWPNEFRAEALPLMAAYACLQDWDGLLFFDYAPGQQTLSWFGNQSDPVRWGQFPAAALMFHRHDVAAAGRTIHVGYSQADVFTAGPSHSRREVSPYRQLAYVSLIRNAYFGETYQGGGEMILGARYAPPSDAVANPSRRTSDTRQLHLDAQAGLFTIDTPRTKAAVGLLGQAGHIALQGLSIRSTTPFAAIIATALDNAPIASSRRLLITAVARAENTGQAFADHKRTVPERGRLPVLAEPVHAELSMVVAGPAEVFPLDATGRRCRRVSAVQDGHTLKVTLHEVHSPWCEVVIAR